MNRTKTLVILVLAAVMALSAVGIAAAQDPGDGDRAERRGGRRGGQLHDVVIQTIADSLGVDPSELVLDADQTLRELIEANGGDADAISAEIVAAATANINQSVVDGELTQERADEILSDLDTRVSEALDKTPSNVERDGRGFGRLDVLTIVSEELGLTPEEIREGLQSGQTLEAIITENGGDLDAINAALVANATQNLNDAVTEGRITQERADEILEGLDERVDNALTQPRPEGPREGRGGRGQGSNGNGQPPANGQQPPAGGQPPAEGQAPTTSYTG